MSDGRFWEACGAAASLRGVCVCMCSMRSDPNEPCLPSQANAQTVVKGRGKGAVSFEAIRRSVASLAKLKAWESGILRSMRQRQWIKSRTLFPRVSRSGLHDGAVSIQAAYVRCLPILAPFAPVLAVLPLLTAYPSQAPSGEERARYELAKILATDIVQQAPLPVAQCVGAEATTTQVAGKPRPADAAKLLDYSSIAGAGSTSQCFALVAPRPLVPIQGAVCQCPLRSHNGCAPRTTLLCATGLQAPSCELTLFWRR